MGAAFVVTLREGFEAALILGIAYTYLEKIRAPESYRYVTRGGALGVLASIALGFAVSWLNGPLLDLGPDLIGIAVLLVAVVVLTWHGYWMRRQAAAAKGDIHRRIDSASASRRLWIIGLIAFTGVFREGAETVLFLWGLVAQAGAPSGWSSLAGGALGVLAAGSLGWAVFRGSRGISLTRFFTFTSALLLAVAAGMLATAAGKLQALGVLPQSSALWDTSALLDEGGLVGGFVSGLVGYRSRPSALEVTAYLTYAIGAGWLLFRGARARPWRAETHGVTAAGDAAEQAALD